MKYSIKKLEHTISEKPYEIGMKWFYLNDELSGILKCLFIHLNEVTKQGNSQEKNVVF